MLEVFEITSHIGECLEKKYVAEAPIIHEYSSDI